MNKYIQVFLLLVLPFIWNTSFAGYNLICWGNVSIQYNNNEVATMLLYSSPIDLSNIKEQDAVDRFEEYVKKDVLPSIKEDSGNIYNSEQNKGIKFVKYFDFCDKYFDNLDEARAEIRTMEAKCYSHKVYNFCRKAASAYYRYQSAEHD